jgi:acyl-CoA dehydrogenase
VLASTDRSKGKNGISAFLLDTRTPGFNVNRTMPTMGRLDDSLCEITFADCRIPRVTFGQALAEHQAIQHMIANMAMDLNAAKMVLWEVVWHADRGGNARLKASMVKVLCTEAACRIADKAVQIHGGSGYCRGMVVERVYRDLRVLRIYEGASEIHRNMIARELLS